MATPATSQYLNSEDRVLKKQQLKSLIEELGKVETQQIVDYVVEEVSKGHHLQHFPERQLFWNDCCKNPTLKQFVSELHQLYIRLVNEAVGRNKYASLQMTWMNSVRILLHGPDTEAISSGSNQKCQSTRCPDTVSSPHAAIDAAGKAWKVLEDKAQPNPSDSTKNTVLTSITRSVYNFCQQQMVKFKEGDILLLDREQMEMDRFQEAGFETDEATLFRLGGSALHSTLESHKHTKEHSILQRMQLLPHEKIDMPSNICHLDVHGGMVFMKKEFLGYLSQVRVMIQGLPEQALEYLACLKLVVEDKSSYKPCADSPNALHVVHVHLKYY